MEGKRFVPEQSAGWLTRGQARTSRCRADRHTCMCVCVCSAKSWLFFLTTWFCYMVQELCSRDEMQPRPVQGPCSPCSALTRAMGVCTMGGHLTFLWRLGLRLGRSRRRNERAPAEKKPRILSVHVQWKFLAFSFFTKKKRSPSPAIRP